MSLAGAAWVRQQVSLCSSACMSTVSRGSHSSRKMILAICTCSRRAGTESRLMWGKACRGYSQARNLGVSAWLASPSSRPDSSRFKSSRGTQRVMPPRRGQT
jgi:hypothetical protein